MVKGTIVAIEDVAVIDVGLKTEGRIPLKEFGVSGRSPDLSVGDEVVFISSGSRTRPVKRCCRARRPAAKSWTRLRREIQGG